MRLLKNRTLNKWLGFLVAFLIVLTTIWVSNNLVRQLKKEEQKKVETIVDALELQTSNEIFSVAISDMLLDITSTNTTIPLILIDENGNYSSQINYDKYAEKLESDSLFLEKKLRQMANFDSPIEMQLSFGTQKIYYQNSDLLNKLRYYPLILILIILLFVWFSFWYFRTLNNTQRSFLWAGMAKETAHQIGTPLSSLLGWIELLKMENVDQTAVEHMENDIQRLNQIAERFSKIGSVPDLSENDIVKMAEETYKYLKPRISSHINFHLKSDNDSIKAKFNPELLSWVLENLVRNAVDAMQNKGQIIIEIKDKKDKIQLSVRDDGPGIPARLQKRIFEPGYTTKKRGWGLGLSLAKRIIKDYHKGKIYVASSDNIKGTEFRILLDK